MQKLLRFIIAAVLILSMYPSLEVDKVIAQTVDTSPTTFLNNQAYSRLIEDSDFLNKNSMSVQDIQNFLVSNGSYLASAPPSALGDGANGRTAAQIIYDTAQGSVGNASGDWGGGIININTSTGTISPRVILITLQKEQGLVTNSSPPQRDLDCAMGYESGNGCTWMFDNKPGWKGFTNQVNFGASQLRFNYERANGYASNYQLNGTISMPYNFGASGPSGIVTVVYTNRSTASLYRYTPHITYGNYNFWKFSRSWFGMSGGSGSTVSVNDYSSVTLNTYGASVKIQGVKESASLVYFGSTLVGSGGNTSWSHEFTPNLGSGNYNFVYKNTSGSTLGTKVVTVDKRKPGDIDGNGKIDLADLSLISNAWDLKTEGWDWRNLNPEIDNKVNLLDLSIFANSWEG